MTGDHSQGGGDTSQHKGSQVGFEDLCRDGVGLFELPGRKGLGLFPGREDPGDTFQQRTQGGQMSVHDTVHATTMFDPVHAFLIVGIGEAFGEIAIALDASRSVEHKLVELGDTQGKASRLGFGEDADARIDGVDVAFVLDLDFSRQLGVAAGQLHEGCHRRLAQGAAILVIGTGAVGALAEDVALGKVGEGTVLLILEAGQSPGEVVQGESPTGLAHKRPAQHFIAVFLDDGSGVLVHEVNQVDALQASVCPWLDDFVFAQDQFVQAIDQTELLGDLKRPVMVFPLRARHPPDSVAVT